MSEQKLSLSKLLIEREELQKDLFAFKQAYDSICTRIQESSEASRDLPPLHKWSGSRAVVGSLEMSITLIEQNIEQYSRVVNMIRSGELKDADADERPKLGVLQGGNLDE